MPTPVKDPEAELASAILRQSIRLWKKRFDTRFSPSIRRASKSNGFSSLQYDLEVFFASNWFEYLCDFLPGDYSDIIRKELGIPRIYVQTSIGVLENA